MAYLPQIGLAGLYKLAAPFDTALLDKVIYTCVAVRSLSDVVAAGLDPKEEYYTPKGLSDAAYQTDVQLNVCIVTLQATTGESVVYVPSSYIVGAPSLGGVPYTQVLLAADLGPIPEGLDLSYLKGQIAVLIRDTIGINTTIKVVLASLPTQLSNDEHAALTAARNALIANSKTDRAKLLTATTQLTAAQEHIAELEAFIIAKGGFPPTA